MKTLTVCSLALFLSACASLLPTGDSRIESRWKSFEEARQAFDKITPYRTDVAQLKELGFDPASNPNISLLTYSDIVRRLLPPMAVKEETLDPGVRDCISSQALCRGYEVDYKEINRRRYGNFWLDFLNFRRKVELTGWRFNGVILLKGDTVVYRLWGGQPNIHEFEDSRNPLGPLQGAGESVLGR